MITDSIVRATRVISAVLLAAPLVVLACGAGIEFAMKPGYGVATLSLAGLVFPAIALHRYHASEARIVQCDRELERARAFRRATLEALGTTSAVALAGAAAYLLTGDPRACAGPAFHLLIGAAIWPTDARVVRLVGGASD